MTKRVEEALRNPHVRCLSHPTGRLINRRPENALDLERVFEVALRGGVALEVNGLAPRLDLSGEHVREAIAAGVPIVCSTDAHSIRGLDNMDALRDDRAPRLGDGRERAQHPAARRAPRLARGRNLRVMRMLLVVALGLLAVPATASAKQCGRIHDPYPDTRYEGADLTRIRAVGVTCHRARQVARGAHYKALGLTPPPSGVRHLRWHGWRVTGDLRPPSDRYVATRDGKRVSWRF